MDSTDSDFEKSTPSKRKKYDIKFKLEVAQYAQNYIKAKAAGDKNVPRTLVKNWINQKLQLESFVGCELTIALEGSEDHKIHCFKPEGEIPNGCAFLRAALIRETNNVDLDSTDETNSSDNDDDNSSVDFE